MPAMNSPWKVILAFVAVFIAGVLCGGPVFGWIREKQQENRPGFAERTMHRFDKELGLTAAQKEKVEPILLRAQQDWRQLRQDNMRGITGLIDRMHEELSAELTPEQRVKLEKVRSEFRARAERFRGRTPESDHRRPDGPPARSR
jgi:hypothetical protein